MKSPTTKLLTLALIFFTTLMQAQEDYILEIDGKPISMGLDKPTEVKMGKKTVQLLLKEKDTLQFLDAQFNFKYPKGFKVSKTTIEEGITQYMLMTAEGAGIIVQKYDILNPTMLNEMMVNEVTKESVSYGYSMERADYKRPLSSGQTLEIDKAVLNYKGETNTYEVATIGHKDEGLLIMTMDMGALNNQVETDGKTLIKLFWDSLKIQMPVTN
jgi:hypothetical protein